MTVQLHGDVVGQLASHTQNDSLRIFQRVDIHDDLNERHRESSTRSGGRAGGRAGEGTHLERDLLEVEPIAHVVVSADRFRVVVDHDRFAAEMAQLTQTTYGAPVELDRTSDPVHART